MGQVQHCGVRIACGTCQLRERAGPGKGITFGGVVAQNKRGWRLGSERAVMSLRCGALTG